MASKTESYDFPDTDAAALYVTCARAIAELGFTTLHTDREVGQMTFNTGRSALSWGGQDLMATIVPSSGGSRLIMGGSIAKSGMPGGGSQLVSWGEKGKRIAGLWTL